ncbi:T9SS type A sorting domain-containing protein [bacterium]|nr:T9SS type A sorting domain-containing protein [bacterium]
MKHFFVFVLLCALGFGLQAAPGDTTHVRVHNAVDMTWYGSYNATGGFPAPGTEYHRVNLRFTIGCATGGCSDWDYTVLIHLLKPTGVLDSNIASIDTLSTNPLVIDTTWNVYEVQERFEMARMITPYGGYMRTGANGFNSQWKHTLVWDATDYQNLLRDSVEFEIVYQGYSSGFSATLDFEMIEGVPARRPVKVQNVYPHRGFSYLNSTTVESQFLPSVNLTLEPGVDKAVLHTITSGHGFVNALNCAEFCQREYRVKVNGFQQYAQSMWRDDCGINPVYPQGGTWLYDRANWCPGAKALTHEHDMSPFLTANQAFDLDLDIEPYSYTVPAGETPAGYNWSTLLLQFSEFPHSLDAELEDILSPSTETEHKRLNPACGMAVVRIRNKGTQPLQSVEIRYGYEHAPEQSYVWTGNLRFMESAIVELPLGDSTQWVQWQGSNRFYAQVVSPNGGVDENALNDATWSRFQAPPVHPASIRFNLRTNTQGWHTFWTLTDASGAVVDQGDNLASNTVFAYDWNLMPGCYRLSIGDRGKNGLSWWANNEGAGYARFTPIGSPVPFKQFQADFGTELEYWFTVGMGLGNEETEKPKFGVFPNPGSGLFEVLLEPGLGDVDYSLTDLNGRLLQQAPLQPVNGRVELHLESLPKGVYLLTLRAQHRVLGVERLVLTGE